MLKINGPKIRDLRESKGLTQLYVATYVGVTTDTVSRWENQHYQSIKKENAIKLAESLEVPLEDLLEISSNIEKHIRQPLQRLKQIWFVWPLIIIIIIGLFWVWMGDKTGIKVNAQRVVPSHNPLGAPFPITIIIENKLEESLALIVTEKMPKGIVALNKGRPLFQSNDKKNGIVRWILNSSEKIIILSYMAVIEDVNSTAESYKFSGTILVKHGKSTPLMIHGQNAIQVAPHHWADMNKDDRLDDEEILSAFDRYKVFKGLEEIRQEVEDIWAGNGYQWDSIKRKFIITPSKIDQREEKQ